MKYIITNIAYFTTLIHSTCMTEYFSIILLHNPYITSSCCIFGGYVKQYRSLLLTTLNHQTSEKWTPPACMQNALIKTLQSKYAKTGNYIIKKCHNRCKLYMYKPIRFFKIFLGRVLCDVVILNDNIVIRLLLQSPSVEVVSAETIM